MPDVMSTVNDLKSLPDQALQVELTRPTGAVPAYLVLAEAQRRQTMRQAAQADRARQPVGSVYDDVIRDMMARQPPPGIAPAGMTPVASAAPPAAPPTPQNFKPAVGMAEGGEVDDDDSDDSEDGGDSDTVEMPGKFDLKQAVADTARRHNLNPADLWGVVQTESSGDPNAVGRKTKSGERAVGLMQLMPGTAHQYGVDDRKNPQQSLDAGAQYLHDLYLQFGDWDLARAAYNAGPGNVRKYGGLPPFKETEQYLDRADKFAQQYKGYVPIEEPDPNKPTPIDTPAAAAAEAVKGEVPSPTSDTSGLASGLASLADSAPAPQQGRGFVLPPAYTAPTDDETPAPAAPVAAQQKPQDVEDYYKKLNEMRDLPVRQNPRELAVQKMIDDMYAEAQKRKKPSFWDYLTNFGLGMASTPSRNWAQSIAGGATGMVKGIDAQEEAARKEQLQAMGIDLKLDDQMRTQQDMMIKGASGMWETQQKAVEQAKAHEEAQKQRTMQELLKNRSEIQYQPVSAGIPPGLEVVTPDLLNPSMQYVAAPMRIKLDATQHAKLLPWLPGYKPGDMVPYPEMKQAGIDAAKAAQPKAPNAESQKLMYAGVLKKLDRERVAANLPPINAADLPSVLTAIRESKTLTDDEKGDAIGFAQANATPASAGTTAQIRVEGMQHARLVSLLDTKTGQAFSTDMADFNDMNAKEPGRYVQASVGLPVKSKEAIYADILYNIGHTQESIRRLGTMNATQRAQLALALQSTDPSEAVTSFLHGAVGTAMGHEQQEAVIAIRQLMENAMMLRTLGAMGQGSDDLRHAIIDTLPNAKSPDTAYMLRQLDQFYQTVQRLHKGLPTLGRGDQTPTSPTNPPPPPPAGDDKNKKKKSLDEIFVKPQ